MKAKTWAGVAAAGAGVAVGAYAAYAATSWWRYGKAAAPSADDRDDWLDRFMPTYDIVERHHAAVNADAAITLAAAKEQDLMNLAAVRAIFKTRELVLGAVAVEEAQPHGLLANVLSIGWGVLLEIPDREIIIGAVTRPWEANVTFRALPADRFQSFAEPGFVKIVWTLRADAQPDGTSIFRTETRAVATDPSARDRFRNYWAFASPGIALIRHLSLGPLVREAERRAAQLRVEEPLSATVGV